MASIADLAVRFTGSRPSFTTPGLGFNDQFGFHPQTQGPINGYWVPGKHAISVTDHGGYDLTTGVLHHTDGSAYPVHAFVPLTRAQSDLGMNNAFDLVWNAVAKKFEIYVGNNQDDSLTYRLPDETATHIIDSPQWTAYRDAVIAGGSSTTDIDPVTGGPNLDHAGIPSALLHTLREQFWWVSGTHKVVDTPHRPAGNYFSAQFATIGTAAPTGTPSDEGDFYVSIPDATAAETSNDSWVPNHPGITVPQAGWELYKSVASGSLAWVKQADFSEVVEHHDEVVEVSHQEPIKQPYQFFQYPGVATTSSVYPPAAPATGTTANPDKPPTYTPQPDMHKSGTVADPFVTSYLRFDTDTFTFHTFKAVGGAWVEEPRPVDHTNADQVGYIREPGLSPALAGAIAKGAATKVVAATIPAHPGTDAGKHLAVKADGSLEWVDPLPAHAVADKDKHLVVQADGSLAWVAQLAPGAVPRPQVVGTLNDRDALTGIQIGDIVYVSANGHSFISTAQDPTPDQWSLLERPGMGIVPNAAARPTTPSPGDIIFQQDTSTAYIYNGTNWVPVAPSGAGGSVTVIADTAARPAGPSAGDVVYQQDTKTAYVYSGTAWVPVLSPPLTTAQRDAAMALLPDNITEAISAADERDAIRPLYDALIDWPK